LPAIPPPPADLPPEEPSPVDELLGPTDRAAALRRIPRIAAGAVGMVREAAPRQLAFAIGLQIMSALLLGGQLLVVKQLVGKLLKIAQDSDVSATTVLPAFGGIVAATVGIGLVGALLQQQQQLITELNGQHIMNRIIGVAAGVELERFEDSAFYDELERATAAGMVRPTQMVTGLMNLLLGLLTAGGVVVVLATLEPLLLPLVALAGVPMLLAALQNSRRTYRFEYAMTTHARERLHLFELFVEREPAKELRVFSATGFLRRRYDALTAERVSRYRAFLRDRLKVSLLGVLASAVGSALALGALTWLLATDRTDVATATTAALAMQLLASRMSAITSAVGTLVESGMFVDDLRTFLEAGDAATERAAERASRGLPAERFDALEVNGLSFTYPGTARQVLDDVSLEVRRGEVVALVGENGSGKTTLVKLLCQLYESPLGTIRWNGTDVTELEPESLRFQMTVLFQDFVRYHLTAADNIALGRPDAPRDPAELEAAARRGGVHEALQRLPRGYETRLGRQFVGGHELSGGQWQRLALARAFYRGGDFLIMDEPTAALDPRAEYRLFEQMRDLAAGKSVLLISHRFANVRMADRIYVLDAGRVVEAGDHAQLMATDGLYAELFRLQASSYAER
jgi:ATP-binding cassette subfamily B protein